jgi:two-component system, OmpR family, phosphate regulon sensor histidine kinase PhoR
MLERRSLKAPITLGVVMILTVVALTVGWIAINIVAWTVDRDSAAVYYITLATGSIGLAVVLAGVIAYLTLSVKAINLNRRQSNFIDSVTHELKSPIASLKLYLQTLSRRSVSQSQRDDFHRIMLADVERLDQLINHLLDAARIERGADTTQPEDVRLDELLRHCARAVCVRYGVDPATVSVDAPPLVVHSHPTELDILFRNLIDNGVKYGGSPPQVTVTATAHSGRRVAVTVSDNGQGIPPNLRRKVFGRFVRLGSELERSKPGTGLGLYLVRSVTRSLGGSIQIETHHRHRDPTSENGHDSLDAGQLTAGSSENHDVATGTTFRVTLPYASSSDNPAGGTESHTDSNSSPAKAIHAAPHPGR